MPKFKYVGPSDEVEFQHGTIWVPVKRNETIELADGEIADSFREQAGAWEEVSSAKSTKDNK